MLNANPGFATGAATVAPDGDADLQTDFDLFNAPDCALCGGMLKPDVVFFGASVPRPRVEAAFEALEEADAVLVVGSSLMAYSGYRFCERAHAAGKPIAAINHGRMRADALLHLKIDADCGAALTAIVARRQGRSRIQLRSATGRTRAISSTRPSGGPTWTPRRARSTASSTAPAT